MEFERAEEKTYAQLKADHIADYKSYYDRANISLCDNSSGNSTLPTDERLALVKEGNPDNKLIDIDSEFTAPSRPHILVPNALEICRQGLFSAACNKKISAEIVIHFNKLVVGIALFHKCKSFVCWQGGIT